MYRLLLLFIPVLFSTQSNAGCITTDSTIVSIIQDSQNGQSVKSYDYTTFKTDSGKYFHCQYLLSGTQWIQSTCDSGYYTDTKLSYDSNGRLIEELHRNGTPGGWIDHDKHILQYNAAGRILLDASLSYNSGSWDTTAVTYRSYDSQNILTQLTIRVNSSGSMMNYRHRYYSINGGRRDSLFIQHGNGNGWVTDSMFTFYYNGNIRTGLDFYDYDSSSSALAFVAHADYDTANNYRANVVIYDTSISGTWTLIDTTRFEMDTLEHTFLTSHFHVDVTSFGWFSSQTYFYVNDLPYIATDFGANVWTWTDPPDSLHADIDYACTYPALVYFYDSLQRVIEIDDNSRCAMPRFNGQYYTYDATGFLTDYVDVSESNTSDSYFHKRNFHAIDNPVLAIPPWIPQTACSGTETNANLVIAGGCGPFRVQWTPSTGLSNDTILNPDITINDSVSYVIAITDVYGDTTYANLNIGVYTTTLSYDSICSNHIWGTLHATTTLEYTPYIIWFRDSIQILSGYNLMSCPVTQTGNYHFRASSSCQVNSDTISILTNPTVAHINYITICEGNQVILPGGQTADTEGSYFYAYPGTSGCDSTIQTDLTVLPSYADTITDTIYSGQSYSLPNGTFATQPGNYLNVFTNSSGCDSVIVVNLLSSLINSVIEGSIENIFSVIPVPFTEHLKIISNVNNAHLKILSSEGRLMTDEILTEGFNSIDTYDFPAGLYFIQLFDGKEYHLKIVEKQ